jgi:hypothetical protein
MARPRADLQLILEAVLGTDIVYYQPPENIMMSFPCIVYELVKMETDKANNGVYRHLNRYKVTVIDRNPDSSIPARMLQLEHSSHDVRFRAEGLYHDVFILYF